MTIVCIGKDMAGITHVLPVPYHLVHTEISLMPHTTASFMLLGPTDTHPCMHWPSLCVSLCTLSLLGPLWRVRASVPHMRALIRVPCTCSPALHVV